MCTSVSLHCRCELSSGSCPRRYCYQAKVHVSMRACKCFLRVMFDFGREFASSQPSPESEYLQGMCLLGVIGVMGILLSTQSPFCLQVCVSSERDVLGMSL